MKQDSIDQFNHFWDVFARVVGEFHGYDWRNKGAGLTRPDRLAYHILKSTRFYVNDRTPLLFGSGRSFDLEEEELLPSREEILSLTEYFRDLCAAWLEDMDLEGENRDFPWTGRTCYGVALFLMRHGTFHLGELEGILNESQYGNTPDLWIAALQGERDGEEEKNSPLKTRNNAKKREEKKERFKNV